MKPVYLITPTGDRPECFKLLTKYVLEQTYQDPIVWVIVDDGKVPLEIPVEVPSHIALDVVRPKHSLSKNSNTQAANMLSGLERVQEGAPALIFEDDDIYLPGHITNVVAALEAYDLVGERVSRYYNVATKRYRERSEVWRASMCSTGVKGSAFEALYEICATHLSCLDVHLWFNYKGSKKLLNTRNVIGIKGMPGRRGIGTGHESSFGRPGPDVLSRWVGPKIAAQYESYMQSRA